MPNAEKFLNYIQNCLKMRNSDSSTVGKSLQYEEFAKENILESTTTESKEQPQQHQE